MPGVWSQLTCACMSDIYGCSLVSVCSSSIPRVNADSTWRPTLPERPVVAVSTGLDSGYALGAPATAPVTRVGLFLTEVICSYPSDTYKGAVKFW